MRRITDQGLKVTRRDLKGVPTVMHTRFLAAVMVLGIISNDVMPLHFQGLRVNAADNKVMESVVKPWIESTRKRKTAHLTKPCQLRLIQKWRSYNLQDHTIPSI